LATSYLIRSGEYHDSVTLMQTAQGLSGLPGVQDAAVVMATDANQAILRQAGLLLPEIEGAGPNDLVIVVLADEDEVAEQAVQWAESQLGQHPITAVAGPGIRPRTIRGAVRSNPQSNLAIISVAGQYAAAEAWEALKSGLHVFLFSDNVDIEDEIALKKYASERGLLMMGAGCGTAILNGVALGFANVVPRGPVGIVAAAGTGLQEVSSLLARQGVGVSQAIGTGGRDLHEAVGAITMLQGLRALQADPDTQVIVLVSKPPSPRIAQRVLDQVAGDDKPTVVCFLGSDPASVSAAGAIAARTLQEAAFLAAAQVQGHKGASVDEVIERETVDLMARAAELRERLGASQKYLRGLFSGGTLAAEALLIWADLHLDVFSNVATEPRLKVRGATRCAANCALDLGEEEFTVGRPHPMIDNNLRIRRLMQEASDPEVAVIVLDVVLGHGAHPDPASELGPAIRRARDQAGKEGRALTVVASVTGTSGDPQGLDRQVQALEAAGAIVCPSNAAAARLAGFIVA
jgi:FdrA protein